MPLSSHLAPGFFRLAYGGTRNPHHIVVPIKFAGTPTPGENADLETADGTSSTFEVALQAFIDGVLAPNLAADTPIGAADLYSVDPTTGVRSFIYTKSTASEGTNVNPVKPFTESVWMFKSTAGKPIKIYIMESVYAADQRNIGSVPADARQDVVTYMLSGDCCVYGRTDSWPLAFRTFTSKTNDVLRRNGGFTDV